MSDEKLRELERRFKETGSVEDEAAWLVERVRVGDLTQERLELAAYLGHEPARRLFEKDPPRTPRDIGGFSSELKRRWNAHQAGVWLAIAAVDLASALAPWSEPNARRGMQLTREWARANSVEEQGRIAASASRLLRPTEDMDKVDVLGPGWAAAVNATYAACAPDPKSWPGRVGRAISFALDSRSIPARFPGNTRRPLPPELLADLRAQVLPWVTRSVLDTERVTPASAEGEVSDIPETRT